MYAFYNSLLDLFEIYPRNLLTSAKTTPSTPPFGHHAARYPEEEEP